jgi:N4-gp56 family major capsid protein
MSFTNFAALTSNQLTLWSRDMWKAARNNMFINRFMGTGPDSMIQRITELKKTEKGARAVITLVTDLEGDGSVGDRQLEGNEEQMKSYDQVITIDQMRHANRAEGRMADQKSVVTFRENSRDVLAYWQADRLDQLALLTLSGVTYNNRTDGLPRVGSDLPYLEFAPTAAADAPTASRYFVWHSSALVANGNNNTITSSDIPTYQMLVQAKAQAQALYVKPIRGVMGEELYNVFMTPLQVAALKKDQDFLTAWRQALPRDKDNPFFKGTDVIYIDGLAIYTYRHVYHVPATNPYGWGSGSNVAGARMLLCGAQALGFADIGDAMWVEKEFDYNNQPGISVAKIVGLKKPKFYSIYSKTTEDFGVITIDTAV